MYIPRPFRRLARFLDGRRRRARLEDTWRRRLVLVTRRLQHVEVQFARELEGLRASGGGLSARAAASTPKSERSEYRELNAELVSTRESRSELERRVAEQEEARAYLEAQHVNQIAEVRSQARRRITALEDELRALAASATEGGVAAPATAELEDHLREHRRALAELEGRHLHEMTQLADESRRRMAESEARVRDSRARAEELDGRVMELERQLEELRKATWEIFQVQGESPPEDLRAGFSRIVELMQVVDDAGARPSRAALNPERESS